MVIKRPQATAIHYNLFIEVYPRACINYLHG